ncbi:hypothetical protein [Streptomyces sp. NBC_00045]|uniref:hypothetical protein n=1 Tax=Streptomyces sp. NBC_00045 TaxID=2975625 RepID=UPI0032438B6A
MRPTSHDEPGIGPPWPAWTAKQAEAMGLLCAECRFDLRTPGAERRLAYNIPTQPDRRRLVCGDCCGNGLDELKRLVAAQAP